MLVNTDHIKSWIEKANDEPDYFDKFVYGFFAFNALYSEYYSKDLAETKVIMNFFNDTYENNKQILKTECLKIFDTPEYDYFCDRSAIRNMRYNSVSYESQRNVETIRERSPKASTRAMLLTLYQIRCNLFHGDKSFGNINDQEIMKNASELLSQYNNIFAKVLKII